MSPEQLPEWRRFDSLRSVRDLGRQALAGLLERIDTKLASAINGPEDES